MSFQPDYRHFETAVQNRRPARLPIYEHQVNPPFMEAALNTRFAALINGGAADQREFFRHYCRFFQTMTYDVISFEVCITAILPDHGALSGGRPGPIQNRAEFEKYPWAELPEIFWRHAAPLFDAMAASLPPGMKAVGGVGNGLFEIAEDLVGLEYLPFMQIDDPPLYTELFQKIGDLMHALWADFLPKYKTHYAACRFGDDLGFKASLLTNPTTVRAHIVPQYRRIIDAVHRAGKLFLWHSCGNIFEIMDDVIALGIDAKHSNEDVIAPFSQWIECYNDRIAIIGGFDLGRLCRSTPDEVYAWVLEKGRLYRSLAKGYALGSGNSIPEYVPLDNYLAMIRAANKIREIESPHTRE